MRDIATSIASALGVLLFLGALLGGVYLQGRVHGTAAERERWTERMAEIDRQVEQHRTEQARRLVRLVDEIDALRARPERVRTVTREVVRHVVADAECSSVPASLRRLWDAEPEDRDTAGTAGVGDAGLRAVADAGR